MILRDMYCPDCYSVSKDVALDSINVLTMLLLCDECRDYTEHLIVVNGGVKTRFRCNDFPTDPRFYRGQVTVEPPTVEEESTGKSVGDLYSDAPIDKREKFVLEERRAERRDRQYFKTDKKHGYSPLFFDQGK